jgi:hypothetical protein
MAPNYACDDQKRLISTRLERLLHFRRRVELYTTPSSTIHRSIFVSRPGVWNDSNPTLEERSYLLYIDGKKKRTQPSHSVKRAKPSTTTTNGVTQAPPQDSDIAGAIESVCSKMLFSIRLFLGKGGV